jgi:hypothetical protein
MKRANTIVLGCAVVILAGCGTLGVMSPAPGRTVEFLSGNASSVVIDYGTRPAGEMQYANAMAKDKCGLFGRPEAVLESVNTRGDDRMRATYLCK